MFDCFIVSIVVNVLLVNMVLGIVVFLICVVSDIWVLNRLLWFINGFCFLCVGLKCRLICRFRFVGRLRDV